MYVKKMPVFQAGKVLTIEMLDALKSAIEATENQKYSGYSDGVLHGFQVEIADDYLIVDKGAFIYQEELFAVSEKTKILYAGNGETQLLVLRIGDKEKTSNFEIREAEFKLIPDGDEILSDLEIARFRLQKGARLRNQFQGLRDMNTSYDTLNLCHARWSAFGGNTMAYPILEMAAREIEKKNNTDIYDEMLLEAIYSAKGESIPGVMIDRYLKRKLGKSVDVTTPEARYKALLNAVNQMSTQEEAPRGEQQKRNNRIIID